MKKWFKITLPLMIIGLMLVSACAAPQVNSSLSSSGEAPYLPKEEDSTTRYEVDAGAGIELSTDRKIIKSGNITLEVESITGAMTEIAAIAESLNGYVVSSNKYEYDSRTHGIVSFRIPAGSFNNALDKLRDMAISVPAESTTSQDVTEEYIDLQAQLHNLQATEAQYLALLGRAATVEEILKVQQALSSVRGQIEQIQGRINYLDRTTDMSLITTSLEEQGTLVTSWSALDPLKTAFQGLVSFGRGLLTALIWLGIFCWAWIPPLVIWLKRRHRKAS
jgi:hypothetical protein